MRLLALLVLLVASGCSSTYLFRESVKADQRADLLAEQGEGAAARYERNRARSLLLESRMRGPHKDMVGR